MKLYSYKKILTHNNNKKKVLKMPSKTFQPMLFDLLAYKWPQTTYEQDFRLRKKKTFANVERIYGERTQRQKTTDLMSRARPFSSSYSSGLEHHNQANHHPHHNHAHNHTCQSNNQFMNNDTNRNHKAHVKMNSLLHFLFAYHI